MSLNATPKNNKDDEIDGLFSLFLAPAAKGAIAGTSSISTEL